MNMEPSPMRNELRVIDVIRRPFEQDHLMIILTINVPSHVKISISEKSRNNPH